MKTLVYTSRVDAISSTDTLIGKAEIGSSESATVWRIMKVVDDGFGHVSVKYSNGVTAFNCSWTDRLTYSYL